ncbi:S-type anion channel SLAH2-like isoform X2 [Malania oleifera]|uniref:S-type anion channel SLAH2-like isoform X2 n=1 Tax=Malania oleifera TaxID=397392 RepID=UPI0025ADC659|nr:S-type anion channel SLAH2-like isoform X2 [Malania oleifera]
MEGLLYPGHQAQQIQSPKRFHIELNSEYINWQLAPELLNMYSCFVMENRRIMGSAKQDSPNIIPPLLQFISSKQVSGFDSIEMNGSLSNQHQATDFQSLSSSAKDETSQLIKSQRSHSVSISMPSSPMNTKMIVLSGTGEAVSENEISSPSVMSKTADTEQPRHAKFYSQPIPTGFSNVERANRNFRYHEKLQFRNPRIYELKDNTFNSFKTWSGKLEKQLTHLRGKCQESEAEASISQNAEIDNLPVDRYFDALEGPELDTLKASEVSVLPEDRKWPFLLRYPVSSFGICLGTSSQAIMWKTLATSSSTNFLHVSLTVNLILWCISVALLAIVSFIYSLKVIFYFEAVRREYYHPVRVNFFFAPWIAILFLAIGVPPSVAHNLHAAMWYVLMTPIFCLELKIYGQWMSGGQRRLSKVANPSNHLSIVGNFVGALLGASMGLKEGPIFFFAVGLAHYAVLFVTLYQRLPTNETLPKDLHPVFFLFVAAPSVASMAWARIQGSFDYGSRIPYFIALFLYFSLAVRVNFFRGFRFSLAWWAYTFPMTGASIATIKYSNEITNIVTQSLSILLSAISTVTVTALLISTIVHAFVLGDLFPNDIAIAISERRPKTSKKWFHQRQGTSDTNDIENYLKFSMPDGQDIEASIKHPSSDTKGN